MGKFNSSKTALAKTARATSPITSVSVVPTGTTFEGGDGYARTAQGELFLLGVNNMVAEGSFYEEALVRDGRFRSLATQVAVSDPQWLAGFLPWLRRDAFMRTAPVDAAVEACHAMVAAKVPGARQLIASVLRRADEPGEMIAASRARHGNSLPTPMKRGIGDALPRLWTEYTMGKYDTRAAGIRFGDVLEMIHPRPASPQQEALFRRAILRAAQDRGRQYRPLDDAEVLPMSAARARFDSAVAAGDAGALLDRQLLRQAGVTWENVLSLAGKTGMDKRQAWEAVVDWMPYGALIKNLRNFDEAGMSDEAAAKVAARISDPERVAAGMLFPYRYVQAYSELASVRWAHPLDVALRHSLANLPALPGRTLILVDTSASMTSSRVSGKSKMTPAKVAAIFGVALAARSADAALYGFADPRPFAHPVKPGASVIAEIERFTKRTGEAGHGTDIPGSLAVTYKGHDRVFVISDMQTVGRMHGVVPKHVPVYGVNLVGYPNGFMPVGSGNRHELGGLNDGTFKMIPALEAGQSAAWPWL